MKGAMEIPKGKKVLREVTNEVNNIQGVEASLKSQRRCLMCGIPGHYQKKCPKAKNGTVE